MSLLERLISTCFYATVIVGCLHFGGVTIIGVEGAVI